MMKWMILSIVIALLAYIVNRQTKHNIFSNILHAKHDPTKQKPGHILYVIGDLHGDVKCAKHWVQKTNLIPNLLTSPPSEWIWNNTSQSQSALDTNAKHNVKTSLLFLGDYIDKGPNSRPTLEFVKSLTDQFPNQVTAILGNHELELLKDRDERYKSWGSASFFQLPYATVHPSEYLHYIPTSAQDSNQADKDMDEIVLDALYNASIEVYANNLYRSVMFTPNGPNSIIHLIEPPSLQKLVSQRLEFYQQNYLNTFRSGTELGKWLETRPIIYSSPAHKFMFVHGGMNAELADYLKSPQHGGIQSNIDTINSMFRQYSKDDTLLPFLWNTKVGRLIEEIITYRGNHKSNGCHDLNEFLKGMESDITRLGVGHTPDENIRFGCKNKFFALDSLLGRWIRESGNDYCRGDRNQRSKNGRYECGKIKDYCEGQIIRITDDIVEVIN